MSDEIPKKDKLGFEAALLEIAQQRECELRELSRLITAGIIRYELCYKGICCDAATGRLLAVKFRMVLDDKDVWIAPDESFDRVFERLRRAPSNAEIKKVEKEAGLLGCTYNGWQADEGHCITDVANTKSTFTVAPGRPVLDALLECRDKYGQEKEPEAGD